MAWRQAEAVSKRACSQTGIVAIDLLVKQTLFGSSCVQALRGQRSADSNSQRAMLCPVQHGLFEIGSRWGLCQLQRAFDIFREDRPDRDSFAHRLYHAFRSFLNFAFLDRVAISSCTSGSERTPHFRAQGPVRYGSRFRLRSLRSFRSAVVSKACLQW